MSPPPYAMTTDAVDATDPNARTTQPEEASAVTTLTETRTDTTLTDKSATAVTAPAQREADPSELVIEVVGGMLGFLGATHFSLVRLDETVDGLFRLVCLDDDLEFVVAAPPLFFPDYAPVIEDDVVERLDLDDSALSLVVLTLTDPLPDSTANLLAPIVINPTTRRAEQVLLADTSWPVRRLLTS